MSKVHNLYLFDEVDYTTIKDIIQELDNIEEDNEVAKVRLTICSFGGYIYPALALYDRMKKFTKDIEAVATGTCQSAGVAILQAARKRISTPNTVFLIHQTNGNIDQTNLRHILVETEQLQKNDKTMDEITIGRSKLNKETYESLIAEPRYLTAQEALEYGFIDEIV